MAERLPSTRNLIVNYLPRFVDEALLRDIFEEHGPVKHTKIIREKNTGRSKTFGFVTYEEHESAMAAIEAKNGFVIGNKKLKVGVARLPSESIENRKLVVKGLPEAFTEQDAMRLFEQYGEVIECRLLTNPKSSRSKGQCFVSFVSGADCMAAFVELPKLVLMPDNKQVTVQVYNKDHFTERNQQKMHMHNHSGMHNPYPMPAAHPAPPPRYLPTRRDLQYLREQPDALGHESMYHSSGSIGGYESTRREWSGEYRYGDDHGHFPRQQQSPHYRETAQSQHYGDRAQPPRSWEHYVQHNEALGRSNRHRGYEPSYSSLYSHSSSASTVSAPYSYPASSQAYHPSEVDRGQAYLPSEADRGQTYHPSEVDRGQTYHPSEVDRGQAYHPSERDRDQAYQAEVDMAYAPTESSAEGPKKCTILLKRVPIDCDFEAIVASFSPYGAISSITDFGDPVLEREVYEGTVEVTIWATHPGIDQLIAFDRQELFISTSVCVDVASVTVQSHRF